MISGILLDLSRQLSRDASKEVQSYVPKTLTQMETSSDLPDLNGRTSVSTFSRPPAFKWVPLRTFNSLRTSDDDAVAA